MLRLIQIPRGEGKGVWVFPTMIQAEFTADDDRPAVFIDTLAGKRFVIKCKSEDESIKIRDELARRANL